MNNNRINAASSFRFVSCMMSVIACGAITCSSAFAEDVAFRLRATDMESNPITTIEVGESFQMQVFVEDMRDPAEGVFAGYLDLEYPASLVSIAGPISYGRDYQSGHSGDMSMPGLVNEAGGFDGVVPLGAGEFLLLSIPFKADFSGEALFESNGPDELPLREVLIYGRNTRVPNDQIDFGTSTLTIVPEPTSATLAMIGILVLLRRRRR